MPKMKNFYVNKENINPRRDKQFMGKRDEEAFHR